MSVKWASTELENGWDKIPEVADLFANVLGESYCGMCNMDNQDFLGESAIAALTAGRISGFNESEEIKGGVFGFSGALDGRPFLVLGDWQGPQQHTLFVRSVDYEFFFNTFPELNGFDM